MRKSRPRNILHRALFLCGFNRTRLPAFNRLVVDLIPFLKPVTRRAPLEAIGSATKNTMRYFCKDATIDATPAAYPHFRVYFRDVRLYLSLPRLTDVPQMAKVNDSALPEMPACAVCGASISSRHTVSLIIDGSCLRFDSDDCLTIFRKLELTHGRAYLKRLLG